MKVFLFGMTLAGLLLGSASQVETAFLMWADIVMSLVLMVGSISSLFLKRG
jgi:hypothetical protein